MMPRIALVTGTFGNEVQNGVGRFLHGLKQWSDGEQYSLDIYSAGHHLRNYQDINNVHALSFPIPGGFQAIEGYYLLEGRRKQLARTLKASKPDVVHISTPEALGMTALAIAKRQRLLAAATYHTDFPAFVERLVHDHLERLRNDQRFLLRPGTPWHALWQRVQPEWMARTSWWERRLLGLIFRRILRRNRAEAEGALKDLISQTAGSARAIVSEFMAAFYGDFDLVLSRSEVYRRKLIDELHLQPQRVRTLRSGVDTQHFNPKPTSADEGLRSRLGIAADHRIILYVGRVTDEKNVGFLADVWRRYAERAAIPTAFVVAGSGNLEEFRARAGAGVHLLGARHGAELSAIYRLADIFWTASEHETLGQVIAESLASGVPVMVPERGAANENVTDGVTGLVLSAGEPARWLHGMRKLLGDSECRQRMKQAARHWAELHSIEASYRHFWQLHADLHEQDCWRDPVPKSGLVIRVPALVTEEPPVFPAAPRAIHLSDFHAGHRSKKVPKEAALRAVCQRAVELGAKVYLQGDFFDTRPKLAKMERDLKMLRSVLAEFEIVPALYLEGNHDYEFARRGEIENMLGCPVAPSLVAREEDTGLILTHGHVSELPALDQIIRDSESAERLIEALSVANLDQALKIAAVQYDLIGILTGTLEEAGLQGLEDVWRHGFAYRRRLADRLLGAAEKYRLEKYGLRSIIHMIGSTNREQTLSQLAAALSGWGLVYGHTHEPHVSKHKTIDPYSGEERTVLLGNCGSFRRKSIPPTWIESQFPALELWAFNIEKNESERIDRVKLTEDDAEPYVGRLRATWPRLCVAMESGQALSTMPAPSGGHGTLHE
jgi:glycosyltransferase involved in cell wall biosynthesis/UDP-2,3-diacylglucosamine pyrophosphatase LpxH